MSTFLFILTMQLLKIKNDVAPRMPTGKLFQALIDEGTNEFRVLDSLAYITGKLLLEEFLVLYLFSTAAGRIDCRYGGLIWCVILNSCISLWFSRLVLRGCQPSSASNLSLSLKVPIVKMK